MESGEEKDDVGLPKWLRYALIAALIISLITTAFKVMGPPRWNYFPSHKPR